MSLLYKKYGKAALILVWAYAALMGVVYFLKIGVSDRNFSNNILYGIFYLMICLLIDRSLKYVNRKRGLFSLAAAVFTAGALVIGAQIEYLEVISWTLSTCAKIFLLASFFVPVFIFLYYFCTEYKTAELYLKWKWIRKWQLLLAVVLVWGIAYLALFPGIYDYDSINQTLQFLVTGEINSHHPVIHSFLLSSFLQLGESLFGNYEIGLGIYSLLQLIFLAYAAVSVSWYLYERKKIRLFILSLVFYFFFPLHYIMAVWATKDVIFSGLFVLVSLSVFKMADRESGYWNRKRNLAGFILMTVLMCMFRNNGIYAMLFLIPVAFFVYKEYRWKTIILIVVSVCIYFSYQNVLLPALGIEPGNMREILSIPCQQMAKVYVENPDVYTEEEKEQLFELIPEQNLKDYEFRPMIADITKNYFNSDAFKEDPGKYIKLYIDIGLKSPRKYIEAFLTNSMGFWYPNKSYPDDRMFHPYVEFNMADPDLFKGDYIYLERYSLFPQYEAVLEKVMLNTAWEKIPVISNFFVPGTYFLVLLYSISVVLYKRNYRYLMPAGIWLGLWITLLISPVALVRYAYPVIMCLPLMGQLLTVDSGNSPE